jgi:hypothetical protein
MTGCLESVPGSTSGFYPVDIREPYATGQWAVYCDMGAGNAGP